METEIQPAKDYYLKQSQYLSGITEQSVEESILAQSYDNVKGHFEESKGRHLLISKYSCSDDGVRRDSVAFLYDKLRDHLDKTPDSSMDNIGDHPINLSPFMPKNVSKREEFIHIQDNPNYDREKSIKNVNFNVQIDSIKQDERSDRILENIKKIDCKYSNFRKGDKGVLTLEDLITVNPKDTASADCRTKRYESKENDNSKMSFTTIS